MAAYRTDFWTAPRDWEGETCVVIGCGPSLTREQVDYCRGKARVIAVNYAQLYAPWADVWYACDFAFWSGWARGREFSGERVTLDPRVDTAQAALMQDTGRHGFDERPWCLRNGGTSAYQAAHLAVHRGASRIVLLGIDHRSVGKAIHFWEAPDVGREPPYDIWLDSWPTLVGPLRERGVQVINCTPGSALRTWPMVRLEEAL